MGKREKRGLFRLYNMLFYRFVSQQLSCKQSHCQRGEKLKGARCKDPEIRFSGLTWVGISSSRFGVQQDVSGECD